jgi:hypothetical protein
MTVYKSVNSIHLLVLQYKLLLSPTKELKTGNPNPSKYICTLLITFCMLTNIVTQHKFLHTPTQPYTVQEGSFLIQESRFLSTE